MSAKYAYGIISTEQHVSFGHPGIQGAEVNTITHGGLACLVSDYSGRDYYTTAARSSLTREEREQILRDLTVHQAVYERVMKQHTVLPIKFGTVVDSGEEVRSLLKQGYDRFSEALAQVEGKVEFDVSATWDPDRVLQQIRREGHIIPKEVTREEGILAGMQLDVELDRRRDDWRQRMVDSLKELALDIQESALAGDEMVMNVALLLHSAQEGDLDRRVEELDARFNDEVNFRVIGPLPPCSFSTVEAYRPGAEELKKAKELLGLGTETCEDEVREAYRERVAKVHPDVNPGDPDAGEKVNGLRQAAASLTVYCRGQGTGPQENGKVTVSLLPEKVSTSFVISLRRATSPFG